MPEVRRPACRMMLANALRGVRAGSREDFSLNASLSQGIGGIFLR